MPSHESWLETVLMTVGCSGSIKIFISHHQLGVYPISAGKYENRCQPEVIRWRNRFDGTYCRYGSCADYDKYHTSKQIHRWHFWTKSRVALFFPYERNTEQVRMPASVGPFFWPSPFWPLDDFFWFFLLNLGSTAPNYSRRPLMRSSKAPPNQKNRGQFLPQPTRTHRSWHPNMLRVTLVGEK